MSDKSKRTPGPWVVATPWAGFSAISGPNGEFIFALGVGSKEERQSAETCEANADALIVWFKLEQLLYRAIRELEYLRINCAPSAETENVIREAMELLEVKDLAQDHLG